MTTFKLSLFLYLSFVVVKSQDNCLLTNNMNQLPTFQGYAAGPEQRIQHQNQAIIPSYRFNCCGNITEWGVDLNPVVAEAKFDFDFQVWRPTPTVGSNDAMCYSLVGNYIERSILPPQTTTAHVARVTPLPRNQLQFQPGDVLGFYVESNEGTTDEDNGVVLLTNSDYTSELVWHASVTALTSQSGNCPYPVGPSGILRTSTHAAPVISISVTTYSCLSQSSQTLITTYTDPTSSHSTTTLSSELPLQTTTSPPDSKNVSRIPIGLIAGVVIAFIMVCGIATVVIVIVAVVKKHKTRGKSFDLTDTGMALSNHTYGAPERVLFNANTHPDSTLDSKPPISVRYAHHVGKDSWNRDMTLMNNKADEAMPTYTEAVPYHYPGTANATSRIDTQSHVYVYVGQPDGECSACVNPNAKEEPVAYEVPIKTGI